MSRLLVGMDESRGGSGSTRQIQPEAEYIKIALPEVDFAAAGIDSGLRPENLSPADYAKLSACAR